jgi:hypothetical protein
MHCKPASLRHSRCRYLAWNWLSDTLNQLSIFWCDSLESVSDWITRRRKWPKCDLLQDLKIGETLTWSSRNVFVMLRNSSTDLLSVPTSPHFSVHCSSLFDLHPLILFIGTRSHFTMTTLSTHMLGQHCLWNPRTAATAPMSSFWSPLCHAAQSPIPCMFDERVRHSFTRRVGPDGLAEYW